MKSYKSSNLRNVAVIGHGKTGKTSLLDACLFNAGAVKRLGSASPRMCSTASRRKRAAA